MPASFNARQPYTDHRVAQGSPLPLMALTEHERLPVASMATTTGSSARRAQVPKSSVNRSVAPNPRGRLLAGAFAWTLRREQRNQPDAS